VDLRRDGGTQVRAEMKPETVDAYAEALSEGADFPPVVAFFDGEVYWLADGFHRVLAHEKAGLVDVLAEVLNGSKRDALFFAIGANAKHGLNRTNQDKRRAVEFLLKDNAWASNSDNWIASVAHVSQPFVGKVRADLAATYNGYKSTERTGKDGRTIDTSGIGKARPAAPVEDAPPPAPPPAPARHPVLDEIDGAADLRALDAAFNRVALAGLSEDDSDAAGEAYRRRSSELREQATPASVPVAPPPSTTPKAQAALFADALAAAPPSDAGEVEALRAEVAAYRAWIASLRERAEHLPVLVKNSTPNLDRARKLVELAGSPNENEARSAAMQACRMIREQGIRLASDNPLVSSDPLDLALRGLYDAARRAGVVL
jgi:hypothetical protein